MEAMSFSPKTSLFSSHKFRHQSLYCWTADLSNANSALLHAYVIKIILGDGEIKVLIVSYGKDRCRMKMDYKKANNLIRRNSYKSCWKKNIALRFNITYLWFESMGWILACDLSQKVWQNYKKRLKNYDLLHFLNCAYSEIFKSETFYRDTHQFCSISSCLKVFSTRPRLQKRLLQS